MHTYFHNKFYCQKYLMRVGRAEFGIEIYVISKINA